MKVNVALLGVGNVGTGVYETIKENSDIILHRDDIEFDVKKVLVRTLDKDRDGIPNNILTTDFDSILNDESIELVVELMGGIHPAKEYVESLLKNGKTIVSANKDMISQHWPSLENAAKQSGAGLYYEASVGGGIPIIKTLQHSLQANKISSISAIINGTTNYILSEMTEKGLPYDTALSQAMELGYAEPDPTSDVEGYDAKFKLSILASMAFHSKVPVDNIYCEGISKVMVQDIEYGKEFGYTMKLLAIGKRKDNNIEVRVHPTFIPNRHPLASVHDAYNAIFIEGDAVGKLMLYGRGAGSRPTASAIISDMVFAAQSTKHSLSTFENTDNGNPAINYVDNWLSDYYIRMIVKDKPGVLATVASIFAKYNISLESLVQKSKGQEQVPLIFITHNAYEKDVMMALESMKNHDSVVSIESIVRVEK